MRFIQFLLVSSLRTWVIIIQFIVGLSLETWIQLIVGVISAGSIIWAANIAKDWNKKNKESKDFDELSYFLVSLQILQETMNYYFTKYMLGDDIGIEDTYGQNYFGPQIKSMISEIYDSKIKLVQLLRPYHDTKDFLYLLFSLNDLSSKIDKIYYYEEEEQNYWNEKIKNLTKFNNEIASELKHNKKSS